MDFAVESDVGRSRAVLAVRGDLDLATVTSLRDEVAAALPSAPLLYLDLTDVTFIDSTGCRELLRAARRGAAAGVQVELVVPVDNRRVRRVIDFMQLGERLPIHDEMPTG